MEDTIKCERLANENRELKIELAIALNQPLLKQLKEAIQRINEGEYISEEDFVKEFNLKTS